MMSNQLIPRSEEWGMSPFESSYGTSMTPFTSTQMSPFDASFGDIGFNKPGSLINSPTMRGITRDVNRMQRRDNRAMMPIAQADLIETDNAYVCHIDVPGVEDVAVTVEDGFLEVKGERKHSYDKDDGFVHKMERSYGKVYRRIELPDSANCDTAKATFKNGVLSINIPKKEGIGKMRRILPLSSA